MNATELLNFKNWVVVGDVTNESKYAAKILKKLKSRGFNVEGVHPKGEGIYKTLKEVPYKIDVIDLCINPISGIKFIEEAKTLNIKYILIQPGAESREILDYCKENDIVAIEGCALVALG
ncbi:CoA-binding protein [Clostridium sp. YIM B02551]|uniref:CoA-binding protein n=1 Tax=Clostridium sp. YIM B02551 TaxID=2910679 RepID=UPI001EEC664F|nr:CoA-binding protein [Clostridium sp. YIM B02551]